MRWLCKGRGRSWDFVHRAGRVYFRNMSRRKSRDKNAFHHTSWLFSFLLLYLSAPSAQDEAVRKYRCELDHLPPRPPTQAPSPSSLSVPLSSRLEPPKAHQYIYCAADRLCLPGHNSACLLWRKPSQIWVSFQIIRNNRDCLSFATEDNQALTMREPHRASV